MKMHELKTINPYFTAIWEGRKSFEIRKNDRDFEEGDILWLREYQMFREHVDYTGRAIVCKVTYILSDFEGLAPGYCAMHISILDMRER